MQVDRERRVDVVVAGGGPAGWAAAVAAARTGARTLLVERNGFLGGTATIGLPLLAYHDCHGKKIVGGIADELVELLVARGGSPGHLTRPLAHLGSTLAPVDGEMVKLMALSIAEEAGVELLLHSLATRPLMSGSTVAGMVVENKTGTETVEARVVIDATGDGDIAARAGAPFEKGRSDGKMQPGSLLFKVVGIELDKIAGTIELEEKIMGRHLGSERESIICIMGTFKRWNDLLRRRDVFPDDDHRMWITSLREGDADINTSRILDVDATDADSLTKAECRARKQVAAIFDFLKTSVPGFEHAALVATAPELGIRETRRFKGRDCLADRSVREGLDSPDGIARCAYAVDIHSPTGQGIVLQGVGGSGSYAVPYGALLPQEIDGLILAGRCIASTHFSLASVRIMPTMMAVGQAAGSAAALAVRQGAKPDRLSVAEIRDLLRSNGAVL